MSCFSSISYYGDEDNVFVFGLDSFDFINENIKSILYPKPNTPHKLIKKLNIQEKTNIFYIRNEKSKIKTSVCEIYPKFQNNSIKKILIFSHGNGCDILTFYQYLKYLANNLNVIVVSYDYPTYGLSQGELNEFTCYQALNDVVSHYLKFTNQILLVGQSLGTGIVIDYVGKNVWSNPIILISPYKSIPKVLVDIDFIDYLICKNKFDSENKISKPTCPIKFFHGKIDNLISHTHTLDLFNLIQNKKFKPTLFENTNHNDILDKIKLDEYREILEFL
jgi:pimeloyl-ACP methyl ester carboxylesterase